MLLNENLLNITDNALKRIKSILIENNTNGMFLSVVKSKSCGEYSYDLSINKEVDKTYECFEYKGVTIFIDSQALLYLVGITIDFEQTVLYSKFIFNNPNASSICGCGKSFNMTT